MNLVVQKKYTLTASVGSKKQLLMNLNISVNCLTREYRKALHEEKVGISEFETKNHFGVNWKNLVKSTNKKSISNEVLLESVKVSHEQPEILKHWRDTFSVIYNPCNTGEEDEPNQEYNTHDNAGHYVNVD